MQERRKLERARRSDRGFSLIELMVVLIILGLIIGIVGPSVWSRLKRGQIVACKAQIQQLEAALMSYQTDMGRLPTTEEGLRALVENTDGSDLWAGPYLNKKQIPRDPWQKDYVYVCPGTHGNEFDLYSKGPDGQDGTADDLTNWN